MQDFARGRVSMTDDSAFEVGRNVATTPGSVVFENDLIQLIQYAPTTARCTSAPLLIVPPMHQQVLHPRPAARQLAGRPRRGTGPRCSGSWRKRRAEQAKLGWDDLHLEQGVMQAIDIALSITGADRVNTLGFCIGGTLMAQYAGRAGRARRRQGKRAPDVC